MNETTNNPNLMHACALRLGSYGVIIKGQSGSGKSTIALALIEWAESINRSAALVSDDYVLLSRDEQTVVATAPDTIKGLIEVRGAGVFRIEHQNKARIDLVVQLEGKGERYPSSEGYEILGIKLPFLRLPSLENANPITICQAIEATLFKRAYKL
ncbi:HPr kinase/phosphorylase [Bartonella sp. HY761]|uniref:HPr kinase/phosphorylase n=1 Tax=Bartonella sp. HY761 TaxID=2979330 RepID=UPI00220BBC6B|nr:HPr kinase/phosphatase C-terminal domain-containing protein [Bartonella sp. HY761]UXN06938.1 HPr kinase/phosphatase C-terminal domain-containing protein [Bartonella sp. HY761]